MPKRDDIRARAATRDIRNAVAMLYRAFYELNASEPMTERLQELDRAAERMLGRKVTAEIFQEPQEVTQ